MQLSICMILKDGPNIIQGLLKNIEELFQSIDYELVIVDNGIDEESLKNISLFNHILLKGNPLDFDKNRNLYLEKARGDWILILDADDRITKEGVFQLIATINQLKPDTCSYYLPYITYIGDGQWSIFRAVRFFRNHRNIIYEDRNMHASLIDHKGEYLLNSAELLFCPLHHVDHIVNQDSYEKRSRNIKRLLIEMEEGKSNDKSYAYLGLEYSAINRIEDALNCYKKALSLNPSCFDAINFMAQILVSQGDFEKAKSVIANLSNCHIYLDRYYTCMSEIAYKQGKMDQAIEYMYKNLKIHPLYPHIHFNMSFLLFNKDNESARSYFINALHFNPYMLNPAIYFKKPEYSIYRYQNAFISGIGDTIQYMRDLFADCPQKGMSIYFNNLIMNLQSS